ncbi:MAG: DUF503 domain-containing protein [Actinobacteria bacterium]|nr:DUF503 domain-containing protein [Actinomycetota bacterium]MCI0543048.1 DUF503 domain-containing protein [Actinomycetota bacterium]MCI0677627.1 DUF503 domain-containing protein [Actinomycetota bacterium]
MRAAALRVELRLPTARSLKEKRGVLRPVVEGVRRLGSYSVAEIDHQDVWQRAAIGVAVVARDGAALEMALASLRRYLDSCLEVEVLDVFRAELEEPE